MTTRRTLPSRISALGFSTTSSPPTVAFLFLLFVLGAAAYRITSTEERGRYLAIVRDVVAQLKAAAMRPRPEVDAFRLVLQARMRYPIVTSTIGVINLIVGLGLL